MKVEYEVVPMEKVPNPPVNTRSGYIGALYEEVRKLGTAEQKALRIPTKDGKKLAYVRAQLRKLADRDGLRLLTSRSQENTVLWA